MSSNDQADASFDRPPFVYEIRVKGRLSDEQWTSWFNDLTVSTAARSVTARSMSTVNWDS